MPPAPARTGRSFDWEAARARLADAIRKTESSRSLGPEQARRILDDRAQALARPMADRSDDEDKLAAIAFSVGSETYAIETRFVREIARLSDLLPLPGTPGFVLGVTKLRGEIHALVDIRALAGAPAAEYPEASRVLALGDKRIEFGLAADTVHEVVRIPVSAIRVPPSVSRQDMLLHVRGITRDSITVLDAAALVGDLRLFIGTPGGASEKFSGEE